MPQPKKKALVPVVDKIFHGSTVNLDGKAFDRCTFRNCVIEMGATAPFSANETVKFEDCRWVFVGAAGLTVEILAALHMMPGLDNVTDEAIAYMRNTSTHSKNVKFSA